MCWAAALAWRFDFCFSHLQRRARFQRRVPKFSRRAVTLRNLGTALRTLMVPRTRVARVRAELQQAVKISEPQPLQGTLAKVFRGEPHGGVSPKELPP